MPSIVAYRKISDATTTYTLHLPDGAAHTELCTIDGTTYVSLADGVTLPAQPEQIAASVEPVALSPVLRAEIEAASPHCKLIDERMRAQIREMYTLEDELKFARFGVGAAMAMYSPTADEIQQMTVYGEFVEGVRQWGRDERAKLGL